jgi:hypothetical protein
MPVVGQRLSTLIVLVRTLCGLIVRASAGFAPRPVRPRLLPAGTRRRSAVSCAFAFRRLSSVDASASSCAPPVPQAGGVDEALVELIVGLVSQRRRSRPPLTNISTSS